MIEPAILLNEFSFFKLEQNKIVAEDKENNNS